MRSSATSDLGATRRLGSYWELQSLGFTDVAFMRRRAAELEISNLEKTRVQTQVGADIVAAFETRLARRPPNRGCTRNPGRGDRVAQAQLSAISPGSPIATCSSTYRGIAADPGSGTGQPRLSRFRVDLQSRPVPAQTRHRPGAADPARPLKGPDIHRNAIFRDSLIIVTLPSEREPQKYLRQLPRKARLRLSSNGSGGISSVSIRILLVEDEPNIAEYLVIGLREEGYTVEHAADGIIAWQHLQAGAWDLILARLVVAGARRARITPPVPCTRPSGRPCSF